MFRRIVTFIAEIEIDLSGKISEAGKPKSLPIYAYCDHALASIFYVRMSSIQIILNVRPIVPNALSIYVGLNLIFSNAFLPLSAELPQPPCRLLDHAQGVP